MFKGGADNSGSLNSAWHDRGTPFSSAAAEHSVYAPCSHRLTCTVIVVCVLRHAKNFINYFPAIS